MGKLRRCLDWQLIHDNGDDMNGVHAGLWAS